MKKSKETKAFSDRAGVSALSPEAPQSTPPKGGSWRCLPFICLGAMLLFAPPAIPATGDGLSPELMRLYESYNAAYFDDALSKRTFVIYGTPTVPNAMADTSVCGERLCIRIDPGYNRAPRVAGMTLLHEMCHVSTEGLELDQHGLKWQACMHKLADKKAFDDLW